MTENKSSKQPERDLSPGLPDYESDTLTTQPRYLHKVIAIFVQFHCLNSYRKDLYRNNFLSTLSVTRQSATSSQIAKVRVRFSVKPEFFQVLFQLLRSFILLRRSRSLSYLYPQFKIRFSAQRNKYPTLLNIVSRKFGILAQKDPVVFLHYK